MGFCHPLLGGASGGEEREDHRGAGTHIKLSDRSATIPKYLKGGLKVTQGRGTTRDGSVSPGPREK